MEILQQCKKKTYIRFRKEHESIILQVNEIMGRTKGIILFSGGLDSLLAVRILQDQGIELTGYHVILPFLSPDLDPETLEAASYARALDLPMIYHRAGEEYLEMLRHPAHGYGKHVNPCIDCKIYCIRKAAELMKQTGADFVATGEVVGQRPMSQLKHMLRHIEKESGIEGRLLRPLSARILEPTIPEKEGLVDRDRLLDINGRGRGRQMELAGHYGIEKYSSPAGGCLFTDTFIAPRIMDLLEHSPDVTPVEIYLQTVGRHFRLSDGFRVTVSRNERENNILEDHIDSAPYAFIPDFSGPSALGKGEPGENDIMTTLSIIARYGKKGSPRTVRIRDPYGKWTSVECPPAIDDNELNNYRI